ncbi:MAG: DUF4231 domain-containing protein [Cyanobacteriota bacterium]|nr:DUF4231 domain-containing protein [Cyanobacteriota bacterium]
MTYSTQEPPSAESTQRSLSLESVAPPEPKKPLIFSVIELLLISACVIAGAIAALYIDSKEAVVYAVVSIIILTLLLLLNKRLLNDDQRDRKKQDNQRKARLYSILFGDAIADESIDVMRQRAIQYCQELIDDYKVVRQQARGLYYVFQISTIVLSGVTPILVLLDKVDINIPWIKWLPVIFPAIAAIVTSLSTSFPLQENWVAANAAVELLEAEQEKFILGVTPAYRFFDVPEEAQRKRKMQASVESFITQVNQIHLKQVQSAVEQDNSKQREKEGSQE